MTTYIHQTSHAALCMPGALSGRQPYQRIARGHWTPDSAEKTANVWQHAGSFARLYMQLHVSAGVAV